MSERILISLVRNGSCVRRYIVTLNESELLPLKVELQVAAQMEMVYVVDCCVLCEQGNRTRRGGGGAA